MKAIIDLVLLGILIICVWSGYKKGIIMGVGGILAILMAIYGANLLAVTFSGDVVPALRPFAGGYTENVIDGKDSPVMKRMGWDGSDLSETDLLAKFPERKQEFATECFKALGLDSRTASTLGAKVVTAMEADNLPPAEAVSLVLCETISFAACFVLAFLLIIIVLTVLGNLPNLSYKLPRWDMVNDIGGAVLGLVTGLMFCATAIWALKFLGILLGSDTLPSTTLGGWLLRRNFLVKYLGV